MYSTYNFWAWFFSAGKIWALQYDNGEEVSLLYTEKDTVRWVFEKAVSRETK